MVKTSTPELKRYLDKKLSLELNGSRKVTGILRGFDPFMNIVLEDTVEFLNGGKDQKQIGSVVIRGNSIAVMEALERIPFQ